MFNNEVKVDGEYARGTIKKATKVTDHLSASNKDRVSRERESAHNHSPYVFHGEVQKHTGDTQKTWNADHLRAAAAELLGVADRIDTENGISEEAVRLAGGWFRHPRN